MNRYHFTGTITLDRICDCPHCDGHEQKVKVDTDIVAASEQQATTKLVAQVMMSTGPFGEWDEGDFEGDMTETELPPSEEMRLTGCPDLFSLASC